MSYYDGSSFSGESYDRHIFEANLSTVNKMQREYWTAKQVLKKKFGKGEDQHVVASDTEIDSKLALFESIQRTCAQLLKELEKYQQCVCALARDENQLGRFLRDQGAQDKTQAGKMMAAVGKSLCYSAQQRLLLRHPLGRLHQDVETFRYRAIADTIMSVDKMEEERTHYRASLLWMQDISSNLDPEQYKKLEKFRKVQNEVRLNKEKFDRLKWAVCQKIDLLTASRSNLFSNTLVPYQDELLKFWEKTARTMSAVLESFKGYQHYEFKLLKGLNPIQELDSKEEENGKEGSEEKDGQTDNDDELINLDKELGATEDLFQDAMEALNLDADNKKQSGESLINFADPPGESDESESKMGGDIYEALRNPDLFSGTNSDNFSWVDADKNKQGDDLLGDLTAGQESMKDDMDLLNDILGTGDQQEATGEFANQWKSVFGEFEPAPQQAPATAASPGGPPVSTEPTPGLGVPAQGPQVPQTHPGSQGYLPSQLMDMHFNSYSTMQGAPGLGPAMNPGMPMMQQQMMNQRGFVPNPPAYSALFTGGQPRQPAPGLQQGPQKGGSQEKGGMAAWYNLFAELDPLQNPDSLGKKDGGTKKQDGDAC